MSNEEDDPKSKFQLIDFEKKRKEVEEKLLEEEGDEEDFQSELLGSYIYARSLFNQIDDPEVQYEALKKLKEAFLLSLDPLYDIDLSIDFEFGVDDDEEDEDDIPEE